MESMVAPVAVQINYINLGKDRMVQMEIDIHLMKVEAAVAAAGTVVLMAAQDTNHLTAVLIIQVASYRM